MNSNYNENDFDSQVNKYSKTITGSGSKFGSCKKFLPDTVHPKNNTQLLSENKASSTKS